MVAFKNRYLVMEVFLDPNKELAREDPIILTHFNVTKAIKDSILLNFGECGLGASLGSFQVKYLNRITKVCIIRASREGYQQIWSAITMVKSIGNCPLFFNLLDLSGWDVFPPPMCCGKKSCSILPGCIRACKNAALRCDQAKFEQYKALAGDKLTPEIIQECNNYFEKIKVLEH